MCSRLSVFLLIELSAANGHRRPSLWPAHPRARRRVVPMSRAAASVPLSSLVGSSDDGAQVSSTSTTAELAATFASEVDAPDPEPPRPANCDPGGTTSKVPRTTLARTASPRTPWLRRLQRRPSLPAEASKAERSRGGLSWAVGLLLACAACKPVQDIKQKCSTQTKCSAGFKCEKDGGPVSGPLDVGECEKDHCAVTVPCEKPQHAQHPKCRASTIWLKPATCTTPTNFASA